MVLSSEGLHLLSNVAVWRHDFETINDKNVAMWHRYYTDVINFYIMKENHREWIDNNNKKKEKKKEYSTSDGWDVIRFQVSEEHRINRTFNTINEFLDHWFYTCHDYQEDSKLEAMYRKDSNGQKERGSTGVQEEARKRYRELNRTDKAIYRAVAKQYFKKRLSIATDTANECDLEFDGMLKVIGNVISDVIYRPN